MSHGAGGGLTIEPDGPLPGPEVAGPGSREEAPGDAGSESKSGVPPTTSSTPPSRSSGDGTKGRVPSTNSSTPSRIGAETFPTSPVVVSTVVVTAPSTGCNGSSISSSTGETVAMMPVIGFSIVPAAVSTTFATVSVIGSTASIAGRVTWPTGSSTTLATGSTTLATGSTTLATGSTTLLARRLWLLARRLWLLARRLRRLQSNPEPAVREPLIARVPVAAQVQIRFRDRSPPEALRRPRRCRGLVLSRRTPRS